MIQGQARKDFEKWVFKNVKHYTTKKPKFGVNTMEFEFNSEFYILPFSMQYGVIVDWFDSVGIYINKLCPDSFEIQYGWDIIEDYSEVDRTRPKARQKAIEQANTIYNDRK